MRPIFVTGTDTGIGKTVVTCGLAAFFALRKGLDVGVLKPFEAGLTLHGKDLLPWDAILLKEASGSQDDLSLINPYCFESPVAPETASELEHVRVDLESVDRIYNQLKARHQILFIEGAGGVLVPITQEFLLRRSHETVGCASACRGQAGTGHDQSHLAHLRAP